MDDWMTVEAERLEDEVEELLEDLKILKRRHETRTGEARKQAFEAMVKVDDRIKMLRSQIDSLRTRRKM